MDRKAWRWRKRSSEKTNKVARDKADYSLRKNDEEGLSVGIGSDTSFTSLNDKIASCFCDCHAKDELVVKKHANIAQEANEGQERAEAQALYLKQELDKAWQQGLGAEAKLTDLDSELKQCIHELRNVQDIQKSRVRDAVMETRTELIQTQKNLEEKLADAGRRLESSSVENMHLSKALLYKERLVEDLIRCKSRADAEFSALMSRVDSTEKENVFLRYEFRVLEKELEIRNEDREFTRRSAEALKNHNVEIVKKNVKLEAECQRLRIMLRKRLPGPAALAKMKGEVEVEFVCRNPTEIRKKKLKPMTGGMVVRDSILERSPEIPSRNVSYLLERLCQVEEENKTLKEIKTRESSEFQLSGTNCHQMTTRLAWIDSQLKELLKDHKPMEVPNKLCVAEGCDIGDKDHIITSSELWASALVSEVQNLRSGGCKTSQESNSLEESDIRLMDDFVEMEKLAIVSIDSPLTSSASLSLTNDLMNTFDKDALFCRSKTEGKELVPITYGDSRVSGMRQEIRVGDELKSDDWLHDILKLVLDQNRVSNRRFEDLLEDIKIAVSYLNNASSSEANAIAASARSCESEQVPQISGYLTWRSPNASSKLDFLNEPSGAHLSTEQAGTQQTKSSLSTSVGKIIELIEGFCPIPSMETTKTDALVEEDQSSFTFKGKAATTDYLLRVFQWKSSELGAVLRQFIQTSNSLLQGVINLERFVEELESVLNWIMTNCITSQHVSSVRDKIKKHFGWDKAHTGNMLGAQLCYPSSGVYKVNALVEDSSPVHSIASSDGMEKMQYHLQEDNGETKAKSIDTRAANFEERRLLTTDKNHSLMFQLRDSEQIIRSLQRELETLKESYLAVEDQIENQKLVNEDLDTQLTVAKLKLNESLQKQSSLEVELEDKVSCCEELEAICLELHLQMESIAKEEIPVYNAHLQEKHLQTGLEVTEASIRLAECQESILNLGKQLKTLASPREAALFDKVFSTTSKTNYNTNKRASLLDRMKADNGIDDMKSPTIKEIVCSVGMNQHELQSGNYDALNAPTIVENPLRTSRSSKGKLSNGMLGPLTLAPSKKQGSSIGFFKKLLYKRRKGKKSSKPHAFLGHLN